LSLAIAAPVDEAPAKSLEEMSVPGRPSKNWSA
jgi:hypothetical protein